ncbi:GSCOCG00007596001-RA-CDS, partial [Cotesia congregata]
MKKFFLFFLAVITILVVINSSVAYKPVRSLKHYRRKPWVYQRPQWQRFSHPHKRPVNKRPSEFHYPPQRRPPRSRYLDRNREPFTIEFELPIEYVENYHRRFKGDFQNYDDDDYTLDDYGDDDA